MAKKMIAVIGAGSAEGSIMKTAEEVGMLIAKGGAVMVCGGLGGVMEAAARGAQSAGGGTIGILPQDRKHDANPYIDIAIPTGFGEGRNVIIARTADVLIAVAGEYGTLSEIAFGLRMGKPVIGIGTWDIKGVIPARDAQEAVGKAFAFLSAK